MIQPGRQQNYLAWRQEHISPTLLGMASVEASVSVLKFFEFIERSGLSIGSSALDIGCGKGRNALALARYGFLVSAFDFVEEAVAILKERAQTAGVDIEAHVGAMDEAWPYPDHTFDLVLDDTASMSIGHEVGILFCRDEMYRVLKPGGYAVIYSLADDDPFLLRFPAGEEPKTVVTPAVVTPDGPVNGKIERLYSLAELRAFFSMFHLIHQEQRKKYGNASGAWERRTVWTLLQKPM